MKTQITNGRLKKLLRSNKILLYIGIILILGSLFFCYRAYTISNNREEAIYLGDLYDEVNDTDRITYVDVFYSPYLFASDDYNKYYIVMDKDNYLSIATLTESKCKEIEEKVANDETYRIQGISKKIENDLKKLAIEAYNEFEDEEILTNENFYTYLGYVYIDVDADFNDNTLEIFWAFLLGISGLALTFIGIGANNRTNKTLNEIGVSTLYSIYDELKEETKEYNNTILTRNHIIMNVTGLIVKEYREILWIFPYYYTNKGVKYNNIALYFKGKPKRINIMIGTGKKEDKINNFISFVQDKNKDVLVGNTKDNKTKYNSLTNS